MMKRGDVVLAKLYGGESVQRRVIELKPKVVVICNEQEWKAASDRGTEPHGLGFPYECIEVLQPPKEKPSRPTVTVLTGGGPTYGFPSIVDGE
jgi:hypothetical protein